MRVKSKGSVFGSSIKYSWKKNVFGTIIEEVTEPVEKIHIQAQVKMVIGCYYTPNAS